MLSAQTQFFILCLEANAEIKVGKGQLAEAGLGVDLATKIKKCKKVQQINILYKN